MTTITWKLKQLDGDSRMGTCDALKLTVESGTWAELVEDICFATEAAIESFREAGDPDRVLEDAGIATGQELNLALDIPFMPGFMHDGSAPAPGC